MYIYGIGGLIMSIWACSVFYKVRKRSENNEDSLIELKNQVASLKNRLDILEGKTNASILTRQNEPEKEESRIEKIKNQISPSLTEKFKKHADQIINGIDNSQYQTDDQLRKDVFSPRDWDETLVASRATWYAQYRYYDELLPLLVTRRVSTNIIDEMCKEAYRLTGCLGINLDGQNSDIMSYMCDVEQQTNGKSEALKFMCKKFDSIGLLDRGHQFGDRMK